MFYQPARLATVKLPADLVGCLLYASGTLSRCLANDLCPASELTLYKGCPGDKKRRLGDPGGLFWIFDAAGAIMPF